MAERTVQLVLHYDGAEFSGWQRQPERRTVQGVVEEALGRLCGAPVSALGSGRTDAGVHARGQAVGVIVPAKWESAQLRRALNAVLPSDVWVASAGAMRPTPPARKRPPHNPHLRSLPPPDPPPLLRPRERDTRPGSAGLEAGGAPGAWGTLSARQSDPHV